MKRMKRLLAVLLLVVMTFSFTFWGCGTEGGGENSSSSTSSYVPTGDNFEDDRVDVIIKEDYSTKDRVWTPADFPLKGNAIKEVIPVGSALWNSLTLMLKERGKDKVIDAVNQLRGLEFIKLAIPHYIYEDVNDAVVSDTNYSSQWGLNGTYGSNVETVWDFTTGATTPRIRVGIFENDIDANHSDLRVANGNFTPNGDIDDEVHGTHVAGIIGAISNNNLGIAGVAQVEIVLLNRKNFSESIDWAIKNDVKIINASFYYTENNLSAGSNAKHVEDLQRFSDSGGIFIASAGNSANNTDDTPQYPGGYADKSKYPTLDNVISVGSINSSGARSSFSNYGANSVSIYAPGTNILSTYPTSICSEYDYIFSDGTRACEMNPEFLRMVQDYMETNNLSWNSIDANFSLLFKSNNGSSLTPKDCTSSSHYSNGYHRMSGTSMATPHVTGVAALLLSYNPDLTAEQLKNAIVNGSDTLSISIPDTTSESGTSTQSVKKLNATKALQYAMDRYCDKTTLTNYDQTVSKTVDASNCHFSKSNYMLSMNVANAYEYDFSVTSTSALDVTLYDSSLNEVSISTTSSNGGRQIDFSAYLALGRYYLQASYVSQTTTGTISIDISNDAHAHSYTTARATGSTVNHRVYCACGAYRLESHVVRIGQFDTTGTCAICGAFVPLSGSLTLNASRAQLVTANGGFIAPNGVVYLVDEDFDAYFNGTLVFYQRIDSSVVSKFGEIPLKELVA